MCPTYRLGPEPLLRGQAPLAEPVAVLSEQEEDFLAQVADEMEEPLGEEPTLVEEWEPGEWESLEEQEWGEEARFEGSWGEEAEGTDDDAERVVGALAMRRVRLEGELQAPRRRLTPCFDAAEVAQTVTHYEQNVDAAASDPPDLLLDRASCIVMLNVGLGQLLGLPTDNVTARTQTKEMPRAPRLVPMGRLTTQSVDGALRQLVSRGLAVGALVTEFTNSRGGRAGTLPPVSLRSSVLDAVTSRSPDSGCWYAFGLSLLHATHSVLLLVDFTGSSRRIYWLDQFTRGLSREVTTTLDADVATFTRGLWQSKRDTKGIGFDTTVRLWRLRKRAS